MFNLTQILTAKLTFPGRFADDNEISAVGVEAIVRLLKNFAEMNNDVQLELSLQGDTKLTLVKSQGQLYVGKEIIG